MIMLLLLMMMMMSVHRRWSRSSSLYLLLLLLLSASCNLNLNLFFLFQPLHLPSSSSSFSSYSHTSSILLVDGFVLSNFLGRILRSKDRGGGGGGGSSSSRRGLLGRPSDYPAKKKKYPINITTARYIKDQVFYQYYWLKRSQGYISNSNSNGNSNSISNSNSNSNSYSYSNSGLAANWDSFVDSNYFFEMACPANSELNSTHQFLSSHIGVSSRPEYFIKVLDPGQVMLKARTIEANEISESDSESTDSDNEGKSDKNNKKSKNSTAADKDKDKRDIIHQYLAILLLLPSHPISQLFYDNTLSIAHMFPNVVFAAGRSDQFPELIDNYYVHSLPCLLFLEEGYFYEQNHDGATPWVS